MVDYTLTIESSPAGIEMNFQALGSSEWIVTNTSKTLPANTPIVLVAPNTVGEPQTTPALGWKFVKWEDNTTNRRRTHTLTANKTMTATYEQQMYYPTRHYSKRLGKFEGKVDSEVYGLRTTALKSMMVEQVAVTSAQQEDLERRVGKYLNNLGLFGTELHHYRNFSQELYRLTRLFTSETLNKEASLKAQKWKTRGLTEDYLKAIANLFNITLTLT